MKKQMIFKAPKYAWVFYLLSFTWGLPMTLIGLFVALFMLITGHKPTRFGWVWAFELPNVNYGLSVGTFMICPKEDTQSNFELKAHEHGHALQNIYFGPLFIFLIAIPSAIRFWYREWIYRKYGYEHYCELPDYDSIWFEGSATLSGINFLNNGR